MTKREKWILLEAADLIEARGLHKGSLEGGHNGPLCMLGACNAAATGYANRIGDADGIWRHPLTTQGKFALPSWNDAPERTKEEAVAKLREWACL